MSRVKAMLPVFAAALTLCVSPLVTRPQAEQVKHTFAVSGTSFVYDGAPIQIRAGEMHYPRIPREYWRDRLMKARAMGLNTISTYVFWNLHEPRPGVWDFSGNLDVAAFVKMAGEEGLHVIVRPGPYVCAEWDLGGYPAWLLADRSLVLRSSDPKFMQASARYLQRVGKELAPLQIGRGGPIIALQVENEYGAFDHDRGYISAVHDQFIAAGFTDAQLFTADNPGSFAGGAIPDLPVVANFGPGNAARSFASLKEFRPNGPMMSGEYWAGWFDAWGTRHANTNGQQQADEIGWMLDQGHSFNLYMFHGGTTFGFMAGANDDRNGYKPDVSSYDYDSALDEAGRPATKFALFRDAIRKRNPTITLPELPAPLPSIDIPEITLTQSASLWNELGIPVLSASPRSMEDLGQSYGYIVYRTKVTSATSGELSMPDMRYYARVFVNGAPVATLDRRLKQTSTTINAPAGATIDVLVEQTARSNYGKSIRDARVGIGDNVTFAGRALAGWQIFPLPMTRVTAAKFSTAKVTGPALHRGTFNITTVGDTFLDMRAWTKGAVWVNGHNLGRFWNIGPQQTLFVPAPFLTPGANDIIVLDLFDAPVSKLVRAQHEPILNEARR